MPIVTEKNQKYVETDFSIAQLTEEELEEAGIDPGLVRLSVGIEKVEDILDDIKKALGNI